MPAAEREHVGDYDVLPTASAALSHFLEENEAVLSDRQREALAKILAVVSAHEDVAKAVGRLDRARTIYASAATGRRVDDPPVDPLAEAVSARNELDSAFARLRRVIADVLAAPRRGLRRAC